MELRAVALKLIEMANTSDGKPISFSGGGGTVLESLKISKRTSDKDWQPHECPVYDPAKPMRLCGMPLVHDAALPVDWLSVLVDGRYVAGSYVHVSSGCSVGITLVLTPTPEVIAASEPPKPTTRRRTAIQ